MNRLGKLMVQASAATVIITATAGAQYQVNNGNALDANNQIGSGGYNGQVQQTPYGSVNNQIITGNVTGGKEFRGNISYSDPNAFRGGTSGDNFDRFIRGSASVSPSGDVSLNNQVVQPYYGQTEVVNLPPGFTRLPGNGGYVPADPAQFNPNDARVGGTANNLSPQAIANAGVTNLAVSTAPLPSRLLRADSALPGRIASPVQDYEVLSPYTTIYRDTAPGGLDFATLQDYQRQLINGDDTTVETDPQTDAQTPIRGSIEGRVAERTDSPTAARLDDNANLASNDRTRASTPLDSDLDPDIRDMKGLPSPEEQSEGYAKLQNRLERFYGDIASDRRNSEPGQDPQQREQANQTRTPQPDATDGLEPNGQANADAINPRPPQDPANPGEAVMGRDPNTGIAEAEQLQNMNRNGGSNDQDNAEVAAITGGQAEGIDQRLSAPLARATGQPVQMPSLVEGVKSRGLAELMRKAETQIKEGNFQNAVDTYEAAEMVAPNQPLTRLGRGHAELAASYYRRSARTLRDALEGDAALMMGQYDLRAMIGADRLGVLVNELKQLANEQPSDPTPVFLLAYISYNTGFTANAEGYLDLADQRAGAGRDPFYGNLKAHWSLGSTQSPDK